MHYVSFIAIIKTNQSPMSIVLMHIVLMHISYLINQFQTLKLETKRLYLRFVMKYNIACDFQQRNCFQFYYTLCFYLENIHEMNDCVSSIIGYPVSYMGRIKKLKADEIMLRKSAFFPAYPFLLGTAIICQTMLSGWMIYYFISSQIHECYSGVTLGIQILACLYPLYQILIFLTLMISISTAKHALWRIIVMALFPIITISFGFGGLGVVYACMINHQDPNAIPSSFLTQNYFIQIIVYSMLVFIIMYIVLVPITSWMQNRRDPRNQRDGCDCCIYSLNFIFQLLLFIGTIIFVGIALGGIPILFYLLNGITKAYTSIQRQFFAFALTSLIAPLGVAIVVFIFSKFIGCGQDQQMEIQTNTKGVQQSNLDDLQNQDSNRQTLTLKDPVQNPFNQDTRRQVLLQNNLSKQFGQDQFMSKSTRKSNVKSSLNK